MAERRRRPTPWFAFVFFIGCTVSVSCTTMEAAVLPPTHDDATLTPQWVIDADGVGGSIVVPSQQTAMGPRRPAQHHLPPVLVSYPKIPGTILVLQVCGDNSTDADEGGSNHGAAVLSQQERRPQNRDCAVQAWDATSGAPRWAWTFLDPPGPFEIFSVNTQGPRVIVAGQWNNVSSGESTTCLLALNASDGSAVWGMDACRHPTTTATTTTTRVNDDLRHSLGGGAFMPGSRVLSSHSGGNADRQGASTTPTSGEMILILNVEEVTGIDASSGVLLYTHGMREWLSLPTGSVILSFVFVDFCSAGVEVGRSKTTTDDDTMVPRNVLCLAFLLRLPPTDGRSMAEEDASTTELIAATVDAATGAVLWRHPRTSSSSVKRRRSRMTLHSGTDVRAFVDVDGRSMATLMGTEVTVIDLMTGTVRFRTEVSHAVLPHGGPFNATVAVYQLALGDDMVCLLPQLLLPPTGEHRHDGGGLKDLRSRLQWNETGYFIAFCLDASSGVVLVNATTTLPSTDRTLQKLRLADGRLYVEAEAHKFNGGCPCFLNIFALDVATIHGVRDPVVSTRAGSVSAGGVLYHLLPPYGPEDYGDDSLNHRQLPVTVSFSWWRGLAVPNQVGWTLWDRLTGAFLGRTTTVPGIVAVGLAVMMSPEGPAKTSVLIVTPDAVRSYASLP